MNGIELKTFLNTRKKIVPRKDRELGGQQKKLIYLSKIIQLEF